jgi:hypothetical protein
LSNKSWLVAKTTCWWSFLPWWWRKRNNTCKASGRILPPKSLSALHAKLSQHQQPWPPTARSLSAATRGTPDHSSLHYQHS